MKLNKYIIYSTFTSVVLVLIILSIYIMHLAISLSLYNYRYRLQPWWTAILLIYENQEHNYTI